MSHNDSTSGHVIVYIVVTKVINCFHFDINGRKFNTTFKIKWGRSSAFWLRHCATKRKVAGSVPLGVFEIFH